MSSNSPTACRIVLLAATAALHNAVRSAGGYIPRSEAKEPLPAIVIRAGGEVEDVSGEKPVLCVRDNDTLDVGLFSHGAFVTLENVRPLPEGSDKIDEEQLYWYWPLPPSARAAGDAAVREEMDKLGDPAGPPPPPVGDGSKAVPAEELGKTRSTRRVSTDDDGA